MALNLFVQHLIAILLIAHIVHQLASGNSSLSSFDLVVFTNRPYDPTVRRQSLYLAFYAAYRLSRGQPNLNPSRLHSPRNVERRTWLISTDHLNLSKEMLISPPGIQSCYCS